MHIEKGIPLAPDSAVRPLRRSGRWSPPTRCWQPLTKLELLMFAMQGEAVASGSLHADNISPSLFGGLC
jgi:homoserine kinase